jgi:hypothetical protein
MNLLFRGLLYFPLINQGCLSAESLSYSFQSINPIRAFSRFRQAGSAIQSSSSGTILEDRSFACSVKSSLIAPPEKLRTLKTLDEEFHPLPDAPILIKRISFQPEMFVVKNLLPFEADRKSLIERAISSEMREASTKSGIVSHRTDCYVASLNCEDSSNISEDEGEQVVSFLEQFLAYLFISSPSSDKIKAEPMQILCYEPNGKYDFHHDGYQRIFTVITYLNGVAGTWFPYAVTTASATQEDEEEATPQMTLSGEGMAVDKQPGKDGVLVIGKMDHKYTNKAERDNRHVVQIEPGDAIVFYNYQWADKEEVRGNLDVHHSKSTTDSGECALTMNWRSLHCGLPASQEKWIATKWFVYDGDN